MAYALDEMEKAKASPITSMTVGECTCGELGTLIDGRCAFCERSSAARRADLPARDLTLAA